MKSTFSLPLFLIAVVITASAMSGFKAKSQDEPWTSQQLLAPADLAKIISDPTARQPIIFSIGPGAIIKNSIDIGPVKEKENMAKLKQELKKLPKDAAIVIYCGCCPFEHCPNIRPAFLLLNKMKFSNHKLLNLPKNIKVDWIDKGYPKNE
jgi:thiosulfate/3-mercaptopyruvate sulfurtransferase